MKKVLAFLAVVLLSATVQAQTFPDGNVVYMSGTADPTGSCIVGTEFYRTDTATRFTCGDGTWSNYSALGGVSWPLLAPDGDIDNPSYSFTSDSDMGMFTAAGGLVLQNQGSAGAYLGRSRAVFGTAAWSLYATDDAVDTRTAFIQGSDEGGTEMRLQGGAIEDTDNESALYFDPDEITFRVENTGNDTATFNLDEGGSTTTTAYSKTGDADHTWTLTSNLGETPSMYFSTGPTTFSITSHIGATFTMSEVSPALFNFGGNLYALDGGLGGGAYSFANYPTAGCYMQAGPNFSCQNKGFPTPGNGGRATLLLGEERWQINAYESAGTSTTRAYIEAVDDSGHEIRLAAYSDPDDHSFLEIRPTSYDFNFNIAGGGINSYYDLTTTEATFTQPLVLPAGTQDLRALQSPNEARAGIHFPAADQATFGAKAASGSYQGEFRASASGSVGKATVYAADGGNSAQLDVYTTYLQASQEMLFPVGSGSAPSITFAGDLDAGMFHAGTDEVRLVVNNAEDYIGVSDTSAYLYSKETTGDDTASVFAQAGTEQVNITTSDNGAAGGTAQVLVTSNQDYVYITANDGTNWGEVHVRATGFDITDSGTQPSCTSATRGTLSKEDNASATEDTFEVCMKMDDDNYTWVSATNDFAQSGTSTLTDATATSLVRFAIAQGTFISGQIHSTIYCDDTTNEVMLRMEHDFACSNDGGTETCGFTNDTAPDLGATASIGTASITTHDVLFSAGTDTVDIQFDTDCSLTPTTFEAAWTVEFAKGYSRTATEQN